MKFEDKVFNVMGVFALGLIGALTVYIGVAIWFMINAGRC